MAKPDILIFTPTEEECQSLAESLTGVEFDGFIPRALFTGPGRDRTRAKVVEAAAPLLAGREKPLVLIGTGRCRPLDGGLTPWEAAASGSVAMKDGDGSRVLKASAPLVQAVIDRLAVKGFRPGHILDESAEESPSEPGCLATDSESAGLALAAAGFLPEPAWFNIRVAAGNDDDYLETLNLKILVTLCTIDRTPPPSACSSCRNPCNVFK